MGMITEPVLTDVEWMLLVELLERERGQLPTEIHHCVVPDAKSHLKQRLRLVEALLLKLQTPSVK
jgi:aromatic ring-cleaving dioxygenase